METNCDGRIYSKRNYLSKTVSSKVEEGEWILVNEVFDYHPDSLLGICPFGECHEPPRDAFRSKFGIFVKTL